MKNGGPALKTTSISDSLTKPFPLSMLMNMILGAKRKKSETIPVHNEQVSQDKEPGSRALNLILKNTSESQFDDYRPRVVLYSHDTMGLGHMRRNLLIAQSIAQSDLNASVLLIAGAKEIGKFDTSTGVDCLVLPSYQKAMNGQYSSRHLDLHINELVSMRSSTIMSSVLAFKPDVMIVDNVPRGALNELEPVLSQLKQQKKTHVVLGLRDVLDEAASVKREWEHRANNEAIRQYFDEIWVYGDPAIYNLCDEYDWPHELAEMTSFTGYLDARKRAVPKNTVTGWDRNSLTQELIASPYTLCMVGGGQDGYELALAFAKAEQQDETRGVIVTGPFMQAEYIDELREIAKNRSNLLVLGFIPEPTSMLSNASKVVAMGGYNTTTEILSYGKHTLLIPRVHPRKEQLIRANRLAEAGYIDMLHPDDLSVDRLSTWLCKDSSAYTEPDRKVDFNGLHRLPEFIRRITHKNSARGTYRVA